MKYTLLSLLFPMLLVACNSVDSDTTYLFDVNPIKTSFEVTDTTRVSLTIRNLTSFPVHYSGCIDPTLQKKIRTKFINLPRYQIVCACTCLNTIPPNDEKIVSYPMSWILGHESAGNKGVFKIIPSLFYDELFTQPVNFDNIKVAEFELK